MTQEQYPPCNKCPNAATIGKLLYCGVDGQIIMTEFHSTCQCQGAKLKQKGKKK